MPIRRTILSALCLMMFGAASARGQQKDPFAEWDNRQPKPAAARPASKSAKTSVTYFSPLNVEAAAEKAAPDSTGQVSMREQSSASNLKQAASSSTSANSRRTAVTGNRIPRIKSTTAGEATTDAHAGTEFDSSIRQAGYESTSDAIKSGRIIRVNGTAPVSDAVDENAFANFLRKSGKAAAAASADSRTNERQDPAVDGETAESVVFDTVPKSRPTVSATMSAAVPASRGTVDFTKDECGPQSPGVTVQWVRKGSFNVGQECEIELVVQNTSKAIVRSVMTEAVIPAEVEILESTPSPMQGTESPTWTFGELKPGETRSVALKVIPRQRGDVRLDAFVRLTGYSSSEFAVEEPMIGVSVTGPEQVEVGEQAGYVVRVSNPGTGIASNVLIQAAVPEGLEHRSGSLLTIEIGTLNPGESRQARLSLTAVKGGSHELAVRAMAEGGLSDETVAAVSVAEPQLNISIAGPAEQLAGRNGEYTLTVSSAGNVPSANVRAKYRLPEGFEYVSADRGGKYAKADHSIEWFVGTLQPNESSEFSVTLKADQTGELMHQAGVISEHGQVTMCDLVTAVEGTAALDLKITAGDSELAVGDEVEWTVVISNSGSREAAGVGMSCELPSALELMDADGPSEHIAENGVMVFRSLASIEAGTDATFRIRARCTREGSHRIRLRVASESITEPLIGEESTLVAGR